MTTWNPNDPTQPAIGPGNQPEQGRAYQAFLQYIQLGPSRTLPDLLNQGPNVPTRSIQTLRSWSSEFAWTQRAAAYDDRLSRQATADYTTRRENALHTGLALEHERIEHLVAIYNRLLALAEDPEAVWVRDVKTVRVDQNQFERVELRRFNGELFRQLRAILDDIAAETGGRINRQPVPPDPLIDTQGCTLDVLTPEERLQFLRLQEKILTPPAEFSQKTMDNHT